MVDQIPTAASWNFDTWLEGTHILVESGPGGPRVMTFTANAAITAGMFTEFATGTVVNVIADSSLISAGIAVETAASGAHIPILMTGIVRGATASGAITPGQRCIGAGAPSGAIKAGTTAGEVIATAISAASTTGATIICFVHH